MFTKETIVHTDVSQAERIGREYVAAQYLFNKNKSAIDSIAELADMSIYIPGLVKVSMIQDELIVCHNKQIELLTKENESLKTQLKGRTTNDG